MELTRKNFPTRFEYRDRDVLRRVTIKQRKEINANHPERPQYYYKIVTYSYPQYGNYLRMTGRRGRQRQYQRTVRHQYDNILELDRLSLNTYNWKYRLGSQKKPIKKPPQKHIKQLYKETRDNYKKKANRRGNTQQEKRRIYKELVERHKRNAKYLDAGDYNSQILGINQDFYYRAQWAFYVHGHLYGLMVVKKPSNQTNPKALPFFPKHAIHLIEELMQKGILKDN